MARVNKNAHILAAYVAAEMPEMESAASEVERAVRAEAAKHRDTGDFERSIKTTRGKTDRFVYTDADDAWPIEFGHTTKKGTEVPGKFIFSNAARRF